MTSTKEELQRLSDRIEDLAVRHDIWRHQIERALKRILRLEIFLKEKLRGDISDVQAEGVPEWLDKETTEET